MRADPLLAGELKTFYGRFECNGGSATESSRQSSDDCYVNYVIAVSSRSEGTKESERQESSRT